MNSKIGVIIQARTDSTRFPKKVLELIEGKPLLWHVIQRCKGINERVIVATTKRKIDCPIVEIAKECNVDYYQGAKDDVLDRYYKTAKKFELDIIIRITADCPLIDPKKSIKVIKPIQSKKFDYAGLHTFPEGLSTEGFSFKSLEKAWKNAKLQSQREHVTPYLYDPENKFRKISIYGKKEFNDHRWVVDYPDDLEFVRKIYSELYKGEIFYMNNVIKLLKEKPEITKLCLPHLRYEGYFKTIKDEGYTHISKNDLKRIDYAVDFIEKISGGKDFSFIDSKFQQIFHGPIFACYFIKFKKMSMQNAIKHLSSKYKIKNFTKNEENVVKLYSKFFH